MTTLNDVYPACAPALEWLVQEVPRLACEADIPRVVEVARQVFSLVRRDAYSDIRAQVIRLELFSSALETASQDWQPRLGRRQRPPTQRKASKWLAEQAEAASMTTEQAVESVYETPERWPFVARKVDPEAWQQVEWKWAVDRAELACKNKNYETARDLFTSVLTGEPKCARALEGLAQVENLLGQPDLAVDHYRAAVLTGHAGPAAWNSLAWTLATRDSPDETDLSEALWAARRAVALAPRSPCWDTLAEVLGRQGDFPAAIAATRESMRLDPSRQAYRERMRSLCDALQLIQAVELEAASDFELEVSDELKEVLSEPGADLAASDLKPEDSDSRREVFAVGEEAVDPDASAAMAYEECDEDDEGFESAASSEMSASWSSSESSPAAERAAPARLPSMGPGRRSILQRMRDLVWRDRRIFISSRTRGDLAGRREFAGPDGNAKQTDLPGPVTDRVCFSLTAPSTLEPGRSYALDVWAYLGNQRAEVMALARQSQGSEDIQIKTKSGVVVTRGTVLTVCLAIPTLEVADPEDTISWEGEIGNATFPVSVPMDVQAGPHAGTATFHVDQFPIAKLHFVLEVGQGSAAIAPLATQLRFKSAFASYASEDRNEVVGRLQGILKVLPNLEIFLDVASLRSGERWEERLLQEVAQRDTLYLFWSQAASRSIWVDREWRAALKLRGIAGIDPIPLVSPEEVPPPTELAQHLHFNDWLLAFVRGRRAAETGDFAPASEQASPASS